MGIANSCFRQPSPERLPEEQQSGSQQSNDQSAGRLSTSIVEFMKMRCYGMKMRCYGMTTETKGNLYPQEKKKQPQESHPSKYKELTLENCLLSSPIQGCCYTTDGDDQFHVLKLSSSNKVYPSLAAERYANYNPAHRCSTERLLRLDEVNSSEADFSSLSRSQSGKTKKRVSFKLPEEADIFIYNPTYEEVEE